MPRFEAPSPARCCCSGVTPEQIRALCSTTHQDEKRRIASSHRLLARHRDREDVRHSHTIHQCETSFCRRANIPLPVPACPTSPHRHLWPPTSHSIPGPRAARMWEDLVRPWRAIGARPPTQRSQIPSRCFTRSPPEARPSGWQVQAEQCPP